jgi:ATP-dependent Lhr-like helicase
VPLRSLENPEVEAPEAVERLRRLLAVEADEVAGTTADESAGTLLAEVVGEWLRYQGPIPPARVAAVFGLGEEALAEVLETLRDSQQVVIDQLSRGAEAPEVCDAENLEVLLRWLRLESRPSFEALPADRLPLFLAHHQGLTHPGDGIEGLQERLEKLLGLPAPAHLWETAILPARLAPYYPAWLDSLMQESELLWLGRGEKRLTFTFRSDLDLLREPEPADDDDNGDGKDEGDEDLDGDLRRLFPDAAGRYDLGELADRTGLATAEVSDRLWRLAWAGRVTNDTFVAVRKGVESKFQPTELAAGRRPGRRLRRRGAAARWQASRPFYGGWSPLPEPPEPLDALEREELAKDRARLLLDRYGVLFRELLRRELPALQWSRVFRALRLMELSGELLAGHFFRGVPGLQFISHGAFRELRRGLPEDAVYWLSAADPASVAGVRVEGLEGELPARHATTFLVYHGARTVLVVRRRGRELDFRVGADHPALGDYLEVLRVLLTREVRPLRSLEVETINGEPARDSPYCRPLGEIFRLDRQTRSIRLWKRY